MAVFHVPVNLPRAPGTTRLYGAKRKRKKNIRREEDDEEEEKIREKSIYTIRG